MRSPLPINPLGTWEELRLAMQAQTLIQEFYKEGS